MYKKLTISILFVCKNVSERAVFCIGVYMRERVSIPFEWAMSGLKGTCYIGHQFWSASSAESSLYEYIFNKYRYIEYFCFSHNIFNYYALSYFKLIDYCFAFTYMFVYSQLYTVNWMYVNKCKSKQSHQLRRVCLTTEYESIILWLVLVFLMIT